MAKDDQSLEEDYKVKREKEYTKFKKKEKEKENKLRGTELMQGSEKNKLQNTLINILRKMMLGPWDNNKLL